jgi:hypothetical protein
MKAGSTLAAAALVLGLGAYSVYVAEADQLRPAQLPELGLKTSIAENGAQEKRAEVTEVASIPGSVTIRATELAPVTATN